MAAPGLVVPTAVWLTPLQADELASGWLCVVGRVTAVWVGCRAFWGHRCSFIWLAVSVAAAIRYKKKMLLCQEMCYILNNTLFGCVCFLFFLFKCSVSEGDPGSNYEPPAWAVLLYQCFWISACVSVFPREVAEVGLFTPHIKFILLAAASVYPIFSTWWRCRICFLLESRCVFFRVWILFPWRQPLNSRSIAAER